MGRFLSLEEHVADSEVREWAEALEKRLGLQSFDAWLSTSGGRADLHVQSLIVPAARRKEGIGTRAMEAVCDFADERGLRATLSPGIHDAGSTTSRSRLVRFYKRFGFVENRGRHSDLALSAGMYREPIHRKR